MLFRFLRDIFILNRLQFFFPTTAPRTLSSEDVISIMLKIEKKTKFSENSRSKFDMYSFLDHAKNHIPEIKMGNPISANPCSLAEVKSVLQSFKGDLNIPHSRQWSIVGWDELPYLLSRRVIHDIPELQDLLIQPWLGHFEINLSKYDIKDLEIVCVWKGGGMEVLMVGVQPLKRNILDSCIFLLFIPSMFHVV